MPKKAKIKPTAVLVQNLFDKFATIMVAKKMNLSEAAHHYCKKFSKEYKWRKRIYVALEKHYRICSKDGNPLWAWAAFQNASLFEKPLPGWVVEYFVKTANGLLDARAVNKSRDIPSIMGFDGKIGGSGSFEQFSAAMQKRMACRRVAEILRNNLSDIENITYLVDYSEEERFLYDPPLVPPVKPITVAEACNIASQELKIFSGETISKWYYDPANFDWVSS